MPDQVTSVPDSSGSGVRTLAVGPDLAIPLALRRHILDQVAAGASFRSVAALHGVSPSFVRKIWHRFATTGEIASGTLGRPAGTGKLAPVLPEVRHWLRRNPDARLLDLACWLSATHGIWISESGLSRALEANGLRLRRSRRRKKWIRRSAV